MAPLGEVGVIDPGNETFGPDVGEIQAGTYGECVGLGVEYKYGLALPCVIAAA